MNAAMLMLALALGQCSNGRCGIGPAVVPWSAPVLVAPVAPAQPAAVQHDPADLLWAQAVDPRDFRMFLLTQAGDCVGVWFADKGVYHSWDAAANRWIEGKPPKGLPNANDRLQTVGEEVINYGVDRSKFSGQESYYVNGRQCSRQHVVDLITGDGQLADDRNKLRLTIIGTEAERKQVLADLGSNADLATLAGNYLVQAYAPDAWAVKDAGFVCTGSPCIYLQAANGKVLHRQTDYTGGAAELASALRKADPNYKPDRDPDKRKPSLPLSIPDLSKIPQEYWLIGGVVLVALLLGRRKETSDHDA